jgi:hypothetical protein
VTESQPGRGAAGRADEVRELVEELRELIARLAAPSGSPRGDEQASPAPESAPASCEWCPLCTLAALLRGQRTELAMTALDCGGVLLGLLRAVLDDAAAHGPAGEHGTDPASGRDAASSRDGEASSKVQRIPVRRR